MLSRAGAGWRWKGSYGKGAIGYQLSAISYRFRGIAASPGRACPGGNSDAGSSLRGFAKIERGGDGHHVDGRRSRHQGADDRRLDRGFPHQEEAGAPAGTDAEEGQGEDTLDGKGDGRPTG